MTLLSIYYDVHKSNSRLRDLKDVQVIMAESKVRKILGYFIYKSMTKKEKQIPVII